MSGAAVGAISDMGHDDADLAPGEANVLPGHARSRERSALSLRETLRMSCR